MQRSRLQDARQVDGLRNMPQAQVRLQKTGRTLCPREGAGGGIAFKGDSEQGRGHGPNW